jgi:hypothetical protein
MAVAPIIGAISIVSAVASAGIQFYGQQKAASAQRRQERIRRRQMDLESARRRKAFLREQAINRAQSLAQVSAQGIGFGGSTAAGATAGISNAAANNVLATNQGQSLGGQMFDAQASEARGRSIAGVGAGIGSLGGALISGYETGQKYGMFS